MKVLITGSAGFLGRHIAAECRSRGYKTVEINLKNGVDCRDYFRGLTPYFDLVFHCAATVGGREGIDFNAAYLAADNFEIDGAMWRWALRTKPGRVVYFSSAASYPTWIQDQGLLSIEDDARPGVHGEPDESYGWVKLMGEMVAQRVRRAGVPVTVVRPFSTYGTDQDETEYPFPAMIERAKRRDDPFVVWGDGAQVRDWLHVDDLVAALFKLVEAEVDGPVNLCTGIGTSMDDLALLCMRVAGYSAPIEHLLDKPVGVRYRVGSRDVLMRYYSPRVTIAEGVRRALVSA